MQICVPRDDQRQPQLMRDVGADLPRIVGTGDVNHVGLEFARRLYRALRVTPEQQVVPEIGVQPEAELTAPKRKLSYGAFDYSLRSRSAVHAEHWQIAPLGESGHLPARMRDAVDLQE